MSKLAIIALDEGSMTAGTVCNIIEIASDTAIGITLPLEQLSWDCGQYPVAIGDRWEDGVFSRDGGPMLSTIRSNPAKRRSRSWKRRWPPCWALRRRCKHDKH